MRSVLVGLSSLLLASLLGGAAAGADRSATVPLTFGWEAAPSLVAGEPRAGALAPGESATYGVELAAGELFSATLQAPDLDAALELAAPSGRAIAQILASKLTDGPWRLSAMTPAQPGSGTFLLRVR